MLWLLFLYAWSQSAQAELRLAPNETPEQVRSSLSPLFESVIRPYGDKHSADFGGGWGKNGTTVSYEGSNYSWILDGKILYSNIGSFTPDVMAIQGCELNHSKERCDWMTRRLNVCHLFLFNGNTLNLETVTRLNITRHKRKLVGLPLCFGPRAMAVAKVVPDAMLITLGYIDSAEPADKNSDPPEFFTTLLLRFSQDKRQLRIAQDDSCLGNPNNIKTISAARQKLASCATKH